MSNSILNGVSYQNDLNPQQHAVCKIFVASHQKGPYKDDNMKALGQYDLSGSVIQCNVEETFQGQTASFTLVPKKPWTELIYTGDWVSIYFSSGASYSDGYDGFGVKGDPEKSNEMIRVFFGFIDAVGTNVNVAGDSGSTVVRISVSCSGINKAFEKTSIYFNPLLGRNSTFGSYLPGLSQLMLRIPLQGTAATLPRAIALSLLGYGGQFLMPDSYPLGVGNPSDRSRRLDLYFKAALEIERSLGLLHTRSTSSQVKASGILEQVNKLAKGNFVPSSIMSILDVFSYVEDLYVDGIAHNTTMHDLSGTVWSNMIENSNPTMNECFLTLMPERETVKGGRIFSGNANDTDEWGQRPKYVPSLVVRERPFGWDDYIYRTPVAIKKKGSKSGTQDYRFGNVFFSSRENPAKVPFLQNPSVPERSVAPINFFNQTTQITTDAIVGRRSLDRIQMRSSDIFAENLRMSDNDHYNFYMVHSSGLFLGEKDQKLTLIQDGLLPMYLPESIKRYGLRVRELSTKFMYRGGSEPSSRNASEFLIRIALAHDYWYQHNPWYRAGTISGRAIPKARVGMALDIYGPGSPGREETFYVEGVSHEWTHTMNGVGRISGTFTVTRGQPSGFSDPKKRFNYGPPDVVRIFIPDDSGGEVEKERKIARTQTTQHPLRSDKRTTNIQQPQKEDIEKRARQLLIELGKSPKTTVTLANEYRISEEEAKRVLDGIKLTPAELQQRKKNEAIAKPQDEFLDQKARALINITAQFEAQGRYDFVTIADGSTAGISYGLVQFNQRRGTLSEVFIEMNKEDPEEFAAIFDPDTANLLNRNYVRSKSTDLSSVSFVAKLKEAAQNTKFQNAQLTVAKQYYFDPLSKVSQEFGVKSERGYAMMFDTAIQFGIVGRNGLRDLLRRGKKKAKEVHSIEIPTEKQVLEQFASIVDREAWIKVRKAFSAQNRIAINAGRPDDVKTPKRQQRRTRLFNSTNLTDNDFLTSKIIPDVNPPIKQPRVKKTIPQIAQQTRTSKTLQTEERQKAGKPPWIEQVELHGEMWDPVRRINDSQKTSGDVSTRRIEKVINKTVLGNKKSI